MKVIGWLIASILLTLLGAARMAFGQPALPTPMHRQLLWIQPNPANVGGYQVRWGTNTLNVSGVNSTSAVIQLEPGQQTLMLRAAGTNGLNSDWTSNTVRLLKLTLQSSTNGAAWSDETNWTWSIFPSPTNKLFRTRMEWSR